MSSFELKYLGHKSELFQSVRDVDTFLDGLTMTFPRDQVPVLLEGLVDLATWANTYDSVMEVYTSNANYIKALVNPYLWCCSCFYPTQKEESHQAPASRWVHLELQQANIYRPLGVHVTLAKETLDDPTQQQQQQQQGGRYEIVGLKFQVPARPRRRDSNNTLSPHDEEFNRSNRSDSFSPPPRRGSHASLVTELGELVQWHQAGALTDDEFALAKAKVLRSG